MEKKDRKELFDLFQQTFVEKSFEVLTGLNPCIIIYNDTRYNVYIKNLTLAQLSNNNYDVWRCQLPKRPIFDDFKSSSDLFLLLGYDASNDVYATWNPYWAKQRLNVGESVSMYSRYSLQKEASEEKKIVSFDLNHKGTVVVFPRVFLPNYIDNICNYFAAETTYVAIGSSLRKGMTESKENFAAETFTIFNDQENLKKFNDYLVLQSIGHDAKRKYIRIIKYLFENDLFMKNKDLFMKYQSLEQYEKAIDEFCELDKIAYEDRMDNGGRHGYIRTSLRVYYKSIIAQSSSHENIIESELFPKKDHVIPNICTSELVEKIAPLMCQVEPQEMEAMQVLFNTFGNTYGGTMQFMDWLNLLRKVDWTELYGRQAGTP